MINALKIAAINTAKTVGGAVALGIGFTVGAAITRATLNGMANAANKLAENKSVKKVERQAAQTVTGVAQAS